MIVLIVVYYRAGSSVVLHKDSPRQEAWNRLKETNPVLRRLVSLRQSFDESENVVVSSIRSITQTIGSWFDENETAQVMKLMKALDPGFKRESFERELREYIVPEVVDAYLAADKEGLKAWCGEAVSVRVLPSNTEGTNLYRRITSCGRLWINISGKVWSAIPKFSTSVKSMCVSFCLIPKKKRTKDLLILGFYGQDIRKQRSRICDYIHYARDPFIPKRQDA
jgi:hypothetical protein